MIKKEYSAKFREEWTVRLNHLYTLSDTENLDPEIAFEIKWSIRVLHKSMQHVVQQKIKNGELVLIT